MNFYHAEHLASHLSVGMLQMAKSKMSSSIAQIGAVEKARNLQRLLNEQSRLKPAPPIFVSTMDASSAAGKSQLNRKSSKRASILSWVLLHSC